MAEKHGRERAHGRGQGREQGQGRARGREWLLPLGIVGALAALYAAVPGAREFAHEAYEVLGSGDRARTERWVRGFGAWGPVAVLALMVGQTVIPVVPSVLLMVVAVLAYGPLWGGVLTFTGLLLAAGVAYGLGRALGPCTVRKIVGERTEKKVEGFVDRYGAGAIVIARISPVVSTDAVSFVAGLVDMGFVRFLLATAAGTLPLTALVAWFGESIDRMKTGLLWVSIVSVVGFVLYIVWDRRRRG